MDRTGPADRRASSSSMRRRSTIVAHQPPPTVLLNHKMYLLVPISSRVRKGHLILLRTLATTAAEELDVGPGTLLGETPTPSGSRVCLRRNEGVALDESSPGTPCRPSRCRARARRGASRERHPRRSRALPGRPLPIVAASVPPPTSRSWPGASSPGGRAGRPLPALRRHRPGGPGRGGWRPAGGRLWSRRVSCVTTQRRRCASCDLKLLSSRGGRVCGELGHRGLAEGLGSDGIRSKYQLGRNGPFPATSPPSYSQRPGRARRADDSEPVAFPASSVRRAQRAGQVGLGCRRVGLPPVPVDHRVQGARTAGLKSVPTLEATRISAACSTVAKLVAITRPLVATRLKRNLPVEALLSTDSVAVSVVPVGGPRCRPV
jgi:hypothetical protein